MLMPSDIEVNLINEVKEIHLLKCLKGANLIGIDTEWRPKIYSFGNVERIAIM